MKAFTLSYPVEPGGRSRLMDELRGLAILLVVTYHICGVTGFPNHEHGELGVDIFVLLSGAALAYSHRPGEGIFRFLWQRLARLLPAYWIMLTLYWQGGIRLLNRAHEPLDVISHYLCIHPWWGDRYFLSINDSFWFLGMAVMLYVVYAPMRGLLDRGRPDILIGLGLLFSFLAACFTFFKMGQPAVFVHLGLRPSIFFVGVAFGLLWRHGTVGIPLSAWLGVGVLASVYGLFFYNLLVGYTVAGFSVFLAYYAMRANADAAGSRPLCRGLGWLGRYSYEIFLIHQPLIREYNHFAWNRYGARVPDPVELALGIAAALVVTVGLAVGLHHLAGFITRLITPRARPAPAAATAG